MDNKRINYQPLPQIIESTKSKRRRDLLPWWVIGSIWIFIVFLALVPFCIIIGFLGHDFNISILGLQTNDPFSVTGIFLMLLFIFKGIVALALWTEKIWAVGLAKIDAAISIAICCLVMAGPLLGFGNVFSIRLELIILVPYFYKMNSIQYDWIYFDDQEINSSDTVISTQDTL